MKGTKDQIFNNPRHPYTQALLFRYTTPEPGQSPQHIKLAKMVNCQARSIHRPGCAFNARCRRRFGPCTQLQPQLKDYGGQLVACFAVDAQDEIRSVNSQNRGHALRFTNQLQQWRQA
ncbi:oligopeptide/dipeptide ABC transporter ATP-binding protein [Escherichia coli]